MKILLSIIFMVAASVLGYFIYRETGPATIVFYAWWVTFKVIDSITIPSFHNKEMAIVLDRVDFSDSEFK